MQEVRTRSLERVRTSDLIQSLASSFEAASTGQTVSSACFITIPAKNGELTSFLRGKGLRRFAILG